MFLQVLGALGAGIVGFKVLQAVRVGKRHSFNNQPLFGRPFGLLERWYAAFSPPRFFSESLIIDGPSPDLDHVIDIIKIMCERFPLLNGALGFSSDLVPSFVKLDMPHMQAFPVRIEKVKQEEWENEITKELHKFFTPRETTQPLWRLSILSDPNVSSFCIILTVHHLLADGLSGAVFFKHFMEIHNDLLAGRTPSKEEIKILLVEDVVDIRPTLTHLLSEIFKSFSPIKKPRQNYLGPPDKNTKLSTHAYYLKITEDVLKPLREACKRENVTLHGALSAAIIFATTVICDKPDLQMSYEYPVSLRKFVDKGSNSNFMGNCVCNANMEFKPTKETLFWNIARIVNKNTGPLTEAGIPLVGMLNYLPVSMDKFVNVTRNKGLPNCRNGTVALSNLGLVDFSHENTGDWRAKELYFAIPNHITGPLISNACATVGDTMNLAITIPNPVLPYSAGEIYRSVLLTSLTIASSESSLTLSKFLKDK